MNVQMQGMIMFFLALYRRLPSFRGKYRIGYRLFRTVLERQEPVEVIVSKHLRYHLPNSRENIGKEIIVKGEYEIESVQAVVAELKKTPCPVLFDIGANIGAISIPVKKRLPATQIHAFEASPATFQYLEKNFEVNNLPTDNINNNLVYSEEKRELSFYDSADYYGKSSLAPVYSKEAITVQSITIDQYCRERKIKKIDLVKVDVQGFELDVFKGMANLLKTKSISALFFEFEDWAEESAGFKAGDSQEYLMEQGYQIFDETGKRMTEPARKGSKMLWARPAHI